jgi:hypothetical protein
VFQKDNFERIVEILQKLLYNTRPLGPLQPRQYYSTRSASSSHKIFGSAVKAILTDFYCKILLQNVIEKSFINWRLLSLVKMNTRVSETPCINDKDMTNIVVNKTEISKPNLTNFARVFTSKSGRICSFY